MSTGEITAWRAGCDWGRGGHKTASALARSQAFIAETFGPDVHQALADMGPDTFAYWFRRGMDDYQAEARRCGGGND